MTGATVFMPLYFQLVLGLDPARAGPCGFDREHARAGTDVQHDVTGPNGRPDGTHEHAGAGHVIEHGHVRPWRAETEGEPGGLPVDIDEHALVAEPADEAIPQSTH